MMKTKKNTIYSRFFYSMVGVSTLFMILLLIVTSIIFSSHFLGQEKTAAFRQLDYIASEFQFYLDSTENYSKTILIDNTVQQKMKKYEADPLGFNALDQLNIKMQINRIIQSISYIHSVTVYSTSGAMVATTENYPSAYTMEPGLYDSAGSWVCVNKHPQTNKNQVLRTFSYIRPIYDHATARALGYLEISLGEPVFSDIYRQHATHSNHIYVTDSHGLIQSSDGSLVPDTEFNRFSHIKPMSGEQFAATSKSVLITRYFPPLGWYIINEIDLIDFITPTALLLFTALVIALVMVGACMLVSSRLSRSITLPLDRLIAHTKTIRDGKWIPIQAPCEDLNIRQLFTSFNRMIAAQEQLKNTLLDAEKQKNQLSLNLLQEQINPHFLYNTLDNICALAELDEKKALIHMVMDLSTFYRESLSQGHFYLTLREELEMTEAYLHILKVRCHNKFNYKVTCPPCLLDCCCLKLLLQPIVENSIYHGIKEVEYEGMLEIVAQDQENAIQITVADNGVGLGEGMEEQVWEGSSGHFGIKNIRQRIRLYYGPEYGLTIGSRPGGGCITTITIGRELA